MSKIKELLEMVLRSKELVLPKGLVKAEHREEVVALQKMYTEVDQFLTLLKAEQPSASKFTNRIRTEPYNPKWKHTVIIQTEDRDALCDRLDRAEASKSDLLEACENSPAADMFVSFANFAEQCTEKPSMAIYKGRFLGLATFLRSCVDRAEKMEAAIAKAKKG